MATTWFAQLNMSQSIDAWAAGQSLIWNSAANGLGSWMTGTSFAAALGAGDVLVANGQPGLAIIANVTCLRISSIAEDPIQGGARGNDGGGFTVSSAVTIAANIMAGNSTSCITTMGSGYTLTINGNITGGGFSSTCGINNATAVNIIVTGNATGGSAGMAIANSTGNITIYGNVTGGGPGSTGGISNSGTVTVYGNVVATTSGSGIYSQLSTAILTINSGNLINTATMQAVSGYISVYNPGPSNYVRCQTSGTVDLALEQPTNVRSGVSDGDVTGTMAVPTAAQVLYNVPVDNTVGTYVEATPAQVQTGVGFGPSSSYTGTDLPAAGPLVGSGNLVD